MGLWRTLTGRTAPARNNLDALFGIPGAAITLESAMNARPTGVGAVCYRAASGPAFIDAERELVEFLDSDEGPDVERVSDGFGFTWLIVRTEPVDMSSLVTDLHAVNTTLQSQGFDQGLLCSVVGFTAAGGQPFGLVYRYRSGTFYPFAQVGHSKDRAVLLEAQVRSQLGRELPIEADQSLWMPVWDCPVLQTQQG